MKQFVTPTSKFPRFDEIERFNFWFAFGGFRFSFTWKRKFFLLFLDSKEKTKWNWLGSKSEQSVKRKCLRLTIPVSTVITMKSVMTRKKTKKKNLMWLQTGWFKLATISLFLIVHSQCIDWLESLFFIFNFNSQRTVHETKGWDVFRDPPIKTDSGSMANQACMEITAKILKLIAYVLTFVLVLCGGVIAKGTWRWY